MRTTLLCLIIAGLALLLGFRQSARIAELESQIEKAKPQQPTKPSTAPERENSAGYRSKAHARNPDATAAQVYQSVLDLVKPVKGGNMMGTEAALQHREAMQEILQLDLKGIRELMELVSESKELKKTRPMQHIASMLCMIAMADADPQAAFAHLMADKNWNRLFSPDDIQDGSMVQYVVARMALDDPQQALESLRAAKEAGKLNSSSNEVLIEIARKDPNAVIDYFLKTNDAAQRDSVSMIGHYMQTDVERSALFQAMRGHIKDHPEQMARTFETLCSPNDNRPESRKWVESLGLPNEEKLLFHEGIGRASVRRGESSDLDLLESMRADARWVAEFMPPSVERETMVWNIVGGITRADPELMTPLLRELGFDPEAMIRRQSEMNR